MARKLYALNVNGDIEGDAGTKGWAIGNGTLTQVDTPAGATWAGTKSMQWLRASGTVSWSVRGGVFGTKPGRVYDLTAAFHPDGTEARCAYPRVEFFDADGDTISVPGNPYEVMPPDAWAVREATVTAPAGAVTACVNCGFSSDVATPVTMDELWVTGHFQISTTGRTNPGPTGDWTVTLTTTTDADPSEYGAWQVWRDGVSQAFIVGEVPATWQGKQPPDTTSTWLMQLYKNVAYPGAPNQQWVPVTTDEQGWAIVSTTKPAGKSVIVNSDGTAYAYVEIQSWPQRRYTRRSATMQVIGSSVPVVTNDFALMPQSSPVLVTRTVQERDALALVLSQPGPLRFLPACEPLDAPWVMPLDFNQDRFANQVARGEWLTEVVFQHIPEPAGITTAAAAASAAPDVPDGAA